MPSIKIERVVSFSSEDPIHSANNILQKDTLKKWKCKAPGEKNASVVLQLDQPYVISGVDIGNEHSAYIEVLVSRSSLPGDYKVLLVMSSFMTPLEARQSQNVNKVRMFKHEDLSEPERNEKWDRVMIVCTQPFNRHVQYGLSFINLYTKEKNLADAGQPLIGKFAVRPESPDNISTGSLFARRKEFQDSTLENNLKGAAAIREATSLAHVVSPAVKHKLKHNSPLTPSHKMSNKVTDDVNIPKPRNRNELLYSKDEENEHEKFSKLTEKVEANKKELPSQGSDKNEAHYEKKRKKDSYKNATVDTTIQNDYKNQNKLQSDPNKQKQVDKFKLNVKVQNKKVVRKPFARLLENVVLVISGIQNPERASLRSMALSMGAKYKADWDSTCTHLVCAFANTPKFHQVKGKGKIVKRTWIEDCYNKKKRLPWRRYALDSADKGIESEEEICEQEDTEYLENDSIKSDSDVDMREEGSDTEDKLEQIKKNQKQTCTFQMDTDNELIDDKTNDNLKINQKLKDFFCNKLFYVDKGFEDQIEKRIKQYIVAYRGTLVDYIQSGINVITNKSNFNNLKDIYAGAICISPDWIWECHNCQKAVLMDSYIFK